MKWTPEQLAEYQKRGLPRGSELNRIKPRGTANPAPANPAAPSQPKVEPAAKKRGNKYGAQKTADADSRKESRRLAELRLRQKAGEIVDLIPHVTFLLIPAQRKADGSKERAVKYTCDAQYVEAGRLVVEDSKSVATRRARDWQFRRKLMLQVYGIEIREV